jgi:hypothetical protein
MYSLLGYLLDDGVVGSVVAVACVGAGCLVWRSLRKRREQRREYRERKRQRKEFWGWE